MTEYDYKEALALENENAFDDVAIREWPTMEFALMPTGYGWKGTEFDAEHEFTVTVHTFVNKEFWDCYQSVVEILDSNGEQIEYALYAMSEKPFHPQGINIYAGDGNQFNFDLHLGRPLEHSEIGELPDQVIEAVKQRVINFEDAYSVKVVYSNC